MAASQLQSQAESIEAFKAQIFNYLSHDELRSLNINGMNIANFDTVVRQADMKTVAMLDKAFSLTEQNIKKQDMKMAKLIAKIASIQEENRVLKQRVKEYDNTYGKYISPFTIIEELYRGINDPYMILNKKESFKIKISTKQFNYWVGIFIDLEIVRRIDKSRLQSIAYYRDAHEILYKNDYTWKGREMKNDIGYVSNDTVAGGESLTKDEKKEITEELTPIFEEK